MSGITSSAVVPDGAQRGGGRQRLRPGQATRSRSGADASSRVASGAGIIVAGSSRTRTSSSRSSPWPVIAPLNSRMPRPSDLPASGSRLGPRTISAIARTTISSMGPILGMALALHEAGLLDDGQDLLHRLALVEGAAGGDAPAQQLADGAGVARLDGDDR